MSRFVRWLLSLLLLLALPAMAGERLDAVIHDLHVHGYSSVAAAVARVQAVEDRPGDSAPLAQRHRYYAALGEYASFAAKPELQALAEEATQRLIAMASKEGCTRCELDAQMTRARLAFTRQDIGDASRVLAALSGEHASPEQQLRLHQLRGVLYRSRGLFAQGVAEAVPAADLAARLGYFADQAVAMNSLVVLNASLGDYQRAESFGQQAYTLAEKISSKRLMADIQLNLGYTYSLSDQPQRQLNAYRRGLEIADDEPGTEQTRVILLSNLSDYWLRAEDYRQALSYAERAGALAKQSDDALGESFAQTNAGVAKAHLGDVDAGVADVRAAIAVAKRIGTPDDVIGITQELVGILEHAARYREALAELRTIESLQAEVTKQKRDKAVLELQEKYSADTRQREIERLADANRIKEAELSVQAWQRRLWAALAVLLALAAVVLVRWLRWVRSVNRQLNDDVAVLAEQSAHDPLTCAFNRRQGHVLLARYSEATRNAAPGAAPTVGVMLLDIDFFKRVNDTWGHAAGDKVLVEVAQRLRGLLRAQDAVVRWGGEEFLLLLPNVRASALAMLAGRVLNAIGGQPVDIGGNAITVTASAGCLASPFGSITDIETLVQVADLALYRAKASGRNRAISVGGAAAELDATSLGDDLAAASAAGLVTVDVVPGPHAGHVEGHVEPPVTAPEGV